MDTPSSSGAGPGGRLLHLHRSGGSSFRRRMRPGGAAAAEVGTPLGGVSYVSTPIPDDDALDAGADKYLLAKTYFDCREYRRCAHVLRGQTGRKAVFLRCYALYMVRHDTGAPVLLFSDVPVCSFERRRASLQIWGRAGGV